MNETAKIHRPTPDPQTVRDSGASNSTPRSGTHQAAMTTLAMGQVCHDPRTRLSQFRTYKFIKRVKKCVCKREPCPSHFLKFRYGVPACSIQQWPCTAPRCLMAMLHVQIVRQGGRLPMLPLKPPPVLRCAIHFTAAKTPRRFRDAVNT